MADLPELRETRRGHVYRLKPGKRPLIYRGRSKRDEILVSIAGELYGYCSQVGDMDEIERKFLRCLEYGPGRALNWLKKRAICTMKPLRQASLLDFEEAK